MFHCEVIPYSLHFRFQAKTSRGVMREKKTWFVKLWNDQDTNRIGWGECGPLSGLSVDFGKEMESEIQRMFQLLRPYLNSESASWKSLSSRWMDKIKLPWFPSVLFALETAWLDWFNGGRRLICDPLFFQGQWQVPINGLVWMNVREAMFQQAMEKAKDGFTTIKLKVGALDWQQELDLIQDIRTELPASEYTIRLDANGAWNPKEALSKLEALHRFDIHSVEQPIRENQPKEMAEICSQSPIPIALDEELINKPFDHQKFTLLEEVQPQYLVLKPTLVGGLGQTDQWIRMAEDLGINWWITSMLESNVGLNAIAQLTAQYRPVLPQGLGTGGLYVNNLTSPLHVNNGMLRYNPLLDWDLSF